MIKGENTTILVDFSWLYYRSKFANQKLTHVIDGVTYSTGTLFGIYETLARLYDSYPQARILFVMDGAPVKQLAVNPDYKGGREKRPLSGFVEFSKWDVAKQFANLPQVEIWHHGQMEADESIAFFTQLKKTSKEEESMLVYSSDGDLRQLIDSEKGIFCIYRSENGEDLPWEDEEFIRTSGVKGLENLTPASIPMFLSITGDGSDNIYGIPRFLKKKAATIAKEYHTPEALQSYLNGDSWGNSPMVADLQKLKDNFKIIVDNFKIVNIDPLGIPKKIEFPDHDGIEFLERYGCIHAAYGMEQMLRNKII